jgi:opacity protein-like surface antigen
MCRKALIGLGLGALLLLCGSRAKADDFTYASCPLGEGYVFLYDSLRGFDVLANLKCGVKLTIVDAGDSNRLKVRTQDGKEGYVLRASITGILHEDQPKAPPSPSPAPSRQEPKPEPPPAPQAPALQLPPQPEPQPQAQPRPQLHSQSEPERPQQKSEPKARPEIRSLPLTKLTAPPPLRQLEPPPPAQPQSAAAAFTPFSDFGYELTVPRLEAFVGYSLINAGTSAVTNRQNATGLESSVVLNLNGWLGGEANVSAYYKKIEILNVGTFGFHDYAIMGGPRFNLTPAFFHALIGIDHVTGSANFFQTSGSPSDNALAAAFGGGVQWKISRPLALRVSADYVLSRFEGLPQANFRATLGIVFEKGSIGTRGQ